MIKAHWMFKTINDFILYRLYPFSVNPRVVTISTPSSIPSLRGVPQACFFMVLSTRCGCLSVMSLFLSAITHPLTDTCISTTTFSLLLCLLYCGLLALRKTASDNLKMNSYCNYWELLMVYFSGISPEILLFRSSARISNTSSGVFFL